MARAIVTQGLVFEAADALVVAGTEPSIIDVQERIGGGSYTTVKRFLEAWKARQIPPPMIALPEAVATRGAAFVRELWSAAAAMSEQRSTQVREDAQRQVAAAQAALASAEAAITRMEAEGEEQAQWLVSQEQLIAGLRDEVAEARNTAQVAEARAAEQARQIEDLQRQVQQRDDVLAEARAASLDQARLTGELAALQRQLQEQTALIERLASGRKDG